MIICFCVLVIVVALFMPRIWTILLETKNGKNKKKIRKEQQQYSQFNRKRKKQTQTKHSELNTQNSHSRPIKKGAKIKSR